MRIPETIRRILKDEGRTQSWVLDEMNKIMPDLKMDRAKFSAIVCGVRKMTADELLVFCKAVKKTPDVFLSSDVEVNREVC